jgi:hypothetical protein
VSSLIGEGFILAYKKTKTYQLSAVMAADKFNFKELQGSVLLILVF